jgi:hypothetical protein
MPLIISPENEDVCFFIFFEISPLKITELFFLYLITMWSMGNFDEELKK